MMFIQDVNFIIKSVCTMAGVLLYVLCIETISLPQFFYIKATRDMFMFVRSYSNGQYAMSDSERCQLDKFYEKSVLDISYSTSFGSYSVYDQRLEM